MPFCIKMFSDDSDSTLKTFSDQNFEQTRTRTQVCIGHRMSIIHNLYGMCVCMHKAVKMAVKFRQGD